MVLNCIENCRVGSYDVGPSEVNMTTADNRDDCIRVSFWFDSLPEPVRPLEPQDFADNIDVAIVGSGFAGLWTAQYLKQAQPELRMGRPVPIADAVLDRLIW